VARPFVTEP